MLSACKGMCMSSGDLDLARADFDVQMAIPCSAMVSLATGKFISSHLIFILCYVVKDGTRANFVLPGSALSSGTRVLFGRLD